MTLNSNVCYCFSPFGRDSFRAFKRQTDSDMVCHNLDFLKVLSNNSSMLVSPLDLSRLTSLALAFATSPLEGDIKSSQGLRKGRLVASLVIF